MSRLRHGCAIGREEPGRRRLRTVVAQRSVLGVCITAMLVPAAVLLGHGVAYAFAIPNPHFRQLVLDRSGHEWWTVAMPVGMILALAAILVVVRRSALSGRPLWDLGPGASGSRLRVWLTAAQVVAFWVLEIGEQAITHGRTAHLFAGIIFTGTLVQFVVALLIAHLVALLATVAARGGVSPALRGPYPVADPGMRYDAPACAPVRTAGNPRGPPPISLCSRC